jgi:hypothetical protein
MPADKPLVSPNCISLQLTLAGSVAPLFLRLPQKSSVGWNPAPLPKIALAFNLIASFGEQKRGGREVHWRAEMQGN